MAKNGSLTPRQWKALKALIECQSVQKAADKSGVKAATIYTYLKQEDFAREYARQCRNLLDEAARSAQKAVSVAITTAMDVCKDKSESGAARVQAARLIVDSALKLTEFCQVTKALDELEVLEDEDQEEKWEGTHDLQKS